MRLARKHWLDCGGCLDEPISTYLVDGLVAEYRKERSCIEGVDEFLSGEGFHKALDY